LQVLVGLQCVVAAPNTIADDYCRRCGLTVPAAEQSISNFVQGVSAAGALSNLLDFAFFGLGQNTVSGNPLSWHSSGTIIGSVVRLPGGFALPNYRIGDKNWFYFTNLPPSLNNAHTVLVWGAGNLNPGPVTGDDGIGIYEVSNDGPFLQSFLARWFGNGEYEYNHYTPGHNRFSEKSYGAGGWDNSLFCAWTTGDSTGFHVGVNVDYPYLHAGFNDYSEDDNSAGQITVLRFGAMSGGASTGWNGLIRGFAYFDTQLSTNTILQINACVPRIGVIVEGDSKSVPPQVWWQWWINNPDGWGLYSVRTNSAQNGTMVSRTNSQAYYRVSGLSMEDRFDADAAAFPTNALFPVTLYALRGGHNDLNATNAPGIVPNALTAITNLWFRARTNGWYPVGWTVDRTGITWTNTGVFVSGASNALMELNGGLRTNSPACDYLVDSEMFYVSKYGETPYTNLAVYSDSIHDYGGSGPLGTNELLCATPTFGYESPGTMLRISSPVLIPFDLFQSSTVGPLPWGVLSARITSLTLPVLGEACFFYGTAFGTNAPLQAQIQ
jgi:hypothetical protein